jgi:transposase-like protein
VKDLPGHRCRSHVAVWKWIQKLGDALEGMFDREELPDEIVVDETVMTEGRRECCVWLAMDPATRAVIYVAITWLRNVLAARSFFRAIRKHYGRYLKVVVADRGVWYPWALRRLGIRYEVVVGGVRSYVERFNETLKDRWRSFDAYNPCDMECDLRHVLHWTRLVVFHYNWVRPHMSRGNRPPIDGFGGSAWWRLKKAVVAAPS